MKTKVAGKRLLLIFVLGYLILLITFYLGISHYVSLIGSSYKEFCLLYPICSMLIGFLISDQYKQTINQAGILSSNSKVQELAIKNPRLWEEVERLLINERIKIARELHEEISSSTHNIALVNMEACRESLLKNDSPAVIKIIQDLKTSISESITKMRKYINQLKLDSFSPKELAAMSDIASQVKVVAKLPRFQQEIKKLILEERSRIARDLHDEVIQNLATILIGLQLCERLLTQDAARAAKELNSLERLAIDSDRKIHELSFRYKPQGVNRGGLIEELGAYIRTFKSISNIMVNMEVHGKEKDVPVEVGTNLVQIIREALANVAKHAKASKVDVRLNFRFNRVLTLISDDGEGFNLSEELERAEQTGHLGLLGMQERAKVLGGSLAIDTEPGQGSRVFVDIPIQ